MRYKRDVGDFQRVGECYICHKFMDGTWWHGRFYCYMDLDEQMDSQEVYKQESRNAYRNFRRFMHRASREFS